MAAVKDTIGSTVEVGDEADHARLSLQDEIEALQRQLEHSTAEVRSNLQSDTPFR
jgi:hypothetical protein